MHHQCRIVGPRRKLEKQIYAQIMKSMEVHLGFTFLCIVLLVCISLPVCISLFLYACACLQVRSCMFPIPCNRYPL